MNNLPGKWYGGPKQGLCTASILGMLILNMAGGFTNHAHAEGQDGSLEHAAIPIQFEIQSQNHNVDLPAPPVPQAQNQNMNPPAHPASVVAPAPAPAPTPVQALAPPGTTAVNFLTSRPEFSPLQGLHQVCMVERPSLSFSQVFQTAGAKQCGVVDPANFHAPGGAANSVSFHPASAAAPIAVGPAYYADDVLDQVEHRQDKDEDIQMMASLPLTDIFYMPLHRGISMAVRPLHGTVVRKLGPNDEVIQQVEYRASDGTLVAVAKTKNKDGDVLPAWFPDFLKPPVIEGLRFLGWDLEAKKGKLIQAEITAYNEPIGKLTASGTPVNVGQVASDPNVVPMGKWVLIPGAEEYNDGKGCSKVTDTGGKVKGNVLDLFVGSESKAQRWGRRHLPVRVFDSEDDCRGYTESQEKEAHLKKNVVMLDRTQELQQQPLL